MTRELKRGEKIVIASHNPGKVREIGPLLEPFGIAVVSAAELDLPEPEETETTFIGNAALKAAAAAQASGLPAIADDSGLEVEALGGAPGIYSARWAGPQKDFNVAMEKVMAELAACNAATDEQRRANFTCAIAIAWPDGECLTFEGKRFGHLVWPMRGTNGFGYDPIFIPDHHDITFGEMDPDIKHKISHRALAFDQFARACLNAFS